MKYPEIDESKLPEVMEIIDAAASLMEEKDCDQDAAAKKELDALQKRLREITGKKNLLITEYNAYWSYTSLETVARNAMHLPPQKSGMTDEQLTELIRRISELDFDVPKNALEATNDYFLQVLEVETGLDDVSDYIYWPDQIGLDLHASLNEITAKILADRK
ncbi:MAG: hypothetical protein K2O91_04445 [Lachnospiraceae bacterium]|nr:hypothetical protein [Lachnospiraceae bacterium]